LLSKRKKNYNIRYYPTIFRTSSSLTSNKMHFVELADCMLTTLCRSKHLLFLVLIWWFQKVLPEEV